MTSPQKKHYEANKQYYIDKARRNQALVRDKVRAAKDKPCVDCGIKYPHYVMDFDHRPGTQKSFGMNQAFKLKGWKVIEAEIAKCDLVCSNCHRERTQHRMIWAGSSEIPGALTAHNKKDCKICE